MPCPICGWASAESSIVCSERMNMGKCTAILLAAGTGSRMKSKTAKQYMMLCGKPVIWYGLQAFEHSSLVDACILVVGAGELAYARQEIVEKYGFQKVCAVIEGGRERFLSVNCALNLLRNSNESLKDSYVMIHDGARPLLTEKLIGELYRDAVQYGACCAAVPVKDTIKVSDGNGFVAHTPERSSLYAVQTPQVFRTELILAAYDALLQKMQAKPEEGIPVTDDAMVVETMLGHPVRLSCGSYDNIKITTPEDMEVAERLLLAAGIA